MHMKITLALLERTVEQVQYEIVMFRFSMNMLQYPLDTGYKNALIESFSVHARNLYHFFYTGAKKRRDGDVIAEDFITDLKIFRSLRTPQKEFQVMLERTGRELSPLRYHGSTYRKRKKPINVPDIQGKIEVTINAFIMALPEERKVWFQ